MENIKLYQDGDRLIVVFEHASANIKKMIQDMLMAAVVNPVKDLKPLAVSAEETIPDTSDMKEVGQSSKNTKKIAKAKGVFMNGEYKGMSPEEAIKKDKNTLKKLFKNFDQFTNNDKEFAEILRKEIGREVLSIVSSMEFCLNTMSKDAIGDFLKEYQYIFKDELRDILEQAGYGTSLTNFLNCEMDSTIKIACQQCIDSVKNRISVV